ncbi:MAG TPA: AI-2E family transporter [Candidatus Saccharimonadales bacterium]|nr:AI-2E family transporter [Candidatus Saccharimonadales bacterium]
MNQKDNRVAITVSNRTLVRVIFIFISAYVLFKLVVKVDHILELIIISVFLSLALNPVVSWLARNLRLKSRFTATGLAYIAVVVLLTSFFYLVIPPFVKQTVNFVDNVPSTLNSLQNSNSPAGKFVNRYHLKNQTNELSQYVKSHIKDLGGPAISTAGRIGSILISIVTVFALTFFMLVEGPVWAKRYWRLRLANKEDWHRDTLERMYRIVTGYVNGQVILALIGGAFALVVLAVTSSILNVSVNSVALAGIIVLTGLIPLIGHLIGGSMVVLACLFVSWPLAIIVGILFLLYQQIENITFQPYIQSKYNELTPLLVFIAALIGVGAAGLVGAFVAIPVAGCLKVLIKEYLYRNRMIEKAAPTA